MSTAVKLSAPWTTFYREVKELFNPDPEIKVLYDEDAGNIKLYVDNAAKADALTKLLPSSKSFGNVTIKVTVIPADKSARKIEGATSKLATLFNQAFDGNPVYSYSYPIEGIFENDFVYIVFQNKVVQFWNDNLSDIHGLCSTLYEDIARDVFEIRGAYYCTDVVDQKDMEWP